MSSSEVTTPVVAAEPETEVKYSGIDKIKDLVKRHHSTAGYGLLGLGSGGAFAAYLLQAYRKYDKIEASKKKNFAQLARELSGDAGIVITSGFGLFATLQLIRYRTFLSQATVWQTCLHAISSSREELKAVYNKINAVFSAVKTSAYVSRGSFSDGVRAASNDDKFKELWTEFSTEDFYAYHKAIKRKWGDTEFKPVTPKDLIRAGFSKGQEKEAAES